MDTNKLTSYLEQTFSFKVTKINKINVKSKTENYKVDIIHNEKSYPILVKIIPNDSSEKREVIRSNMKSVHYGNKMNFLFDTDKKDFLLDNNIILIFNFFLNVNFKLFHQLSEDELLKFIDFYENFIKSLTPNKHIGKVIDVNRVLTSIGTRKKVKPYMMKMLKKLNVFEIEYKEDACQIIHGDLIYKNMFYEKNILYTFIDFEALRLGYPTEDLFKYFLTSFDKILLFNFKAQNQALSNLKTLIKKTNFNRYMWLLAFNLQILVKYINKPKPFIYFFYYIVLFSYYKKCRQIILENTKE